MPMEPSSGSAARGEGPSLKDSLRVDRRAESRVDLPAAGRQPRAMIRAMFPLRGMTVVLLALGVLGRIWAQDVEANIEKLPWKNGPGTARFGNRAEVPYGKEFRVLSGADAVRRLEMSGNEVDADSILGILEHKEDGWWIVLQFDDIGYVKDDEKNDLQEDKILEGYKRGVEERNKRQGGPPTMVVGWHTKPRYNETTHNLEWAPLFQTGRTQFINYQVRILGRKGVTRVTLVEGGDRAAETIPEFRKVMDSFKYLQGESYAEFRSGDKVAKVGLAALAAGGATLAAAKFGLFAKLALLFKKAWKLAIVAVVAVFSFIKKLFTGRRQNDNTFHT